MAKPHTIASHTFGTQATAVAFIQKVLYRHPPLEPIQDAGHEFLLELLKKHPRKAEKIGVGVKHFTVENAKGGTRCFYITRVDGSRSDFSFMKCLRG
jgi:DNA-directed RNA polymerase-4 subunit 1